MGFMSVLEFDMLPGSTPRCSNTRLNYKLLPRVAGPSVPTYVNPGVLIVENCGCTIEPINNPARECTPVTLTE